MNNNNDLIKYTVTAGLAGLCIGYYVSKLKEIKAAKEDEKRRVKREEINLDKLLDKSQYKLVPLLNKLIYFLFFNFFFSSTIMFNFKIELKKRN
jgi:hypothetical protein